MVVVLCCVVILVELSLVKVWMKLKLIGGVVCEFFLRVKFRVMVWGGLLDGERVCGNYNGLSGVEESEWVVGGVCFSV